MELVNKAVLNSELMEEGCTVSVEDIPKGPWAPPAESAEAFRNRIRVAFEEAKGAKGTG